MALVPELAVADLGRSLAFYRALGFQTLWGRPEEGFACIERDGARLMLDEIGGGRDLDFGGSLEHPLGRGVNLEIAVTAVEPLERSCRRLGARLVLPLEDRAYRVGNREARVRQFAVADPDGYVLRFSMPMD